MSKVKLSLGLIIAALVVSGISAQASGVLNSPSGGYLICVDSKTKVVTHPGTTSCPKGAKKLVIGASGKDGVNGLTGAAGLNGLDGKDGKTLWNGVKDPESTWGAPGDMFINSVTKTLFGPKDLATGWPAGVSMVGPKGDQGLQGPQGVAGANGTNATLKITELSICGINGTSLCKVGVQGPAGGMIFFVDYQDEYPGFNYLEVTPPSCEERTDQGGSGQGVQFLSDPVDPEDPVDPRIVAASVPSLREYTAQLVGSGLSNTQTWLGLTNNRQDVIPAYYADSLVCGGKADWFLGSIGEHLLLERNLPGYLFKAPGEANPNSGRKEFWTSTLTTLPDSDESNDQRVYRIRVNTGHVEYDDITLTNTQRVRPFRSF